MHSLSVSVFFTSDTSSSRRASSISIIAVIRSPDVDVHLAALRGARVGDVHSEHAAGDDAATIFAALQADTRHVRDVMATSDNPNETDLLDVLGEFGLLGITPQAEWTGPLVAAVANEGDATLTDGFNRLLMNLQITNRPVRCNSYASIGALVTALNRAGRERADSAGIHGTGCRIATGNGRINRRPDFRRRDRGGNSKHDRQPRSGSGRIGSRR